MTNHFNKEEGMKKIVLFLALTAIIPCLIAISVQASQKSIEPDTVKLILLPGQSASIPKTVIIPATIPKGDVIFAFDLTGSMGDELDVAKAQAGNIMSAIAGLVTDVQFGVMSYMDYPHEYDTCGYSARYGDSSFGDYAYSLDLPLTADTSLVTAAILGLTLGNGYDGPQDYERIFYESYADSINIGYRPGAKRILINIGDCIPHDCNLSEGIDTGTFSTGSDPGRDEIMGTADDLDLQTVLAGMATHGVNLLEVHGSTNCGYLNYWQYWCSLTGGSFFLLTNATQIPAAVESLIEEQALYIDSLTLVEMTPGFEDWLTSLVPPYYLNITAPDTVYFTEEITVPVDTPCGNTYTFQISAIGDGASYGDEIVIVEVPPCGGPEDQVLIPNKVYERFGFGHWDYLPEQDPDAGDNCIVFDEACPGWAGINPGDFFEIPIILRYFDPTLKIGGFELEVDFDYIDLTFYGADRGGLLEKRLVAPNPIPWQDDIFWSWEYFSYRVLPCATCACCKYKILLYGQAEMPDGQFRRGYCISSAYAGEDSLWWYEDVIKDACPDGQPIDAFATLVWLKFQVANNELLRDLKLPIVFEWEAKFDPNPPYHMLQDWDCAENTFSDCYGNALYVSNNMLQYDPTICPSDVENILKFIDGGVHICSPCTAFTCVRGDINMDGVAYSTADAVMLANYFVHGIDVFTIDRDAQVCATDINADGRTLMLSDLIYLIRVIQQDAIPFPKLGPSSDVANLIVSTDGRITVECASAIGGILFKFDGDVTPTLLNNNMELLSNEGNVLVWSSAGNSINAGASELMNTSGAKLVSVMAVDREGRDLATTITTKVAPTTFTLNPAYPNPFNPNTNLSFSLPAAVSYSLNIYNVAGQLVRSYEGMGNVGLNVISWDGKDNAGSDVSSGVYFYKLIAGSFTATKKMIMLK
jgi:hypothetical protein